MSQIKKQLFFFFFHKCFFFKKKEFAYFKCKINLKKFSNELYIRFYDLISLFLSTVINRFYWMPQE